jgi:SAM-dependent methyltransferase
MKFIQHRYYTTYEDRYQRVYAQGVDYWTGDPEEIAAVICLVHDFIEFAKVTPFLHSIIEFGCGEGFLAEHLLQRGFSYLGIDISPSALNKARNRIAGSDSRFMLGDVTNLPEVRSGSFDVAIDNYCLHMFVTDSDRRRYLGEVHRTLKSSGYAWFHEIGQRDRFSDRIESIDEFLVKHPMDLDTCETRGAYTKTGKKTVQLPRLPARFNNCEGYHDEIKAAGFEIEFIESRKSGVVIYARKSEKDFRTSSLSVSGNSDAILIE